LSERSTLDNLAAQSARAIAAAFVGHLARFHEITRRAAERFESRDWHAHEADALERLNMYEVSMDRLTEELRAILGDLFSSRPLWARIKREYAEGADTVNFELARTFYNSVTRRVFSTVGVNTDIEFTSLDLAIVDWEPVPNIVRRYPKPRGLRAVMSQILDDYRFRIGYRDLEADLDTAMRRVETRVREVFGSRPIDAVEMVRPVFFRNKAAYVMGRVRCGDDHMPLILALLNTDDGVLLDAVLMREDEVSILFSFTRSYFHVDVECPRELIVFLKAIIPLKPVSDLYTALGFNKHGKTELYRSLQRHLGRSTDLFDFASGDRGMVMIVFTLPSYDRVFKVIRDTFDLPKTTTAREVIERYRLVYRHDRVGRLVEAQVYRRLKIRINRFEEELTAELLRDASRMVQCEGGFLVFDRMYTERRVTPLNLYLQDAAASEARRAVIDYGDAIKELATANIFPGDFLLKNFGVTRHGRVVFYDYDELCLLTDCKFRRLPQPRTPEDELDPEPWFAVGENDIFPEEFRRFLGLPRPLLSVFEQHHGDLFTPDYWRGLQQQHDAGVLPNFFPYPDSERLDVTGPA